MSISARSETSARSHVLIEGADVACPSCGETIAISIDTAAGRRQRYTEDCSVCCRPLVVSVTCQPGEIEAIDVAAE